MPKKGKLELTWVGKDERIKLEPRVLVEDPSKSYGDQKAENMLIYGDNLLALKALEQDFAGQIKCIYIDPPFNTGSAFEHYDDGLEHSIWLDLMAKRFEILNRLLSDDGAIFVHIDYNEEAYLRVIMDEIFGRGNFRNTIIVSRIRKNVREREKVKALNYSHDVIVFYAKSEKCLITPPLKESKKEDRWHSFEAAGVRKGMDYELFGFKPKLGNHWRWTLERSQKAIDKKTLRPNPNTGKPEYLIKASQFEIMDTNWTDLTASSFRWDFQNGEKSERLIQRVIDMVADDGDWVLDSFAGSGTTGAVAHKMGRRWIMCELGEHCHTHIIPRMKAVIDGTDQGGISKAVNWQGGGGFKYYRLAESLLVTDKDLSSKNHPVYIINPRYDEKMLIRAICKIENFRYRNEGRLHGISSENRFLHVTTNLLTQVYLDSLAEDVGKDQSLLIYCTRKKRGLVVPDNIEIKKIPRDLLRKCDFQEDVK